MLSMIAMALSLVTTVAGTVVTTTHGPVRGVETAGTLRFLGIPYAKPPLGALRFKPPESPEPWTDIKDATTFGPTCMHETASESINEDCLTLNIYLPGIEVDLTQKRAVMVWIHGDLPAGSSAMKFDLSLLASRGDVIGVTLDYRLGVFGFFTTGDDDVTGNAALYDQVKALEWIRDNIGNFGGDRSRVTIFGQGFGGESVSAHVLSPVSSGLFQRAISQSGALLPSPSPHYSELTQAAKDIARALGCVDTMPDMLTCLQGVSAGRLREVSSDTFQAAPLVVIDDRMITKPYGDLWREWTNPHDISYMAGLNSDDGDVYLQILRTEQFVQDLQSGISDDVYVYLRRGAIQDSEYDMRVYDVLHDQYLPGDPVTDMSRLRAIIQGITDGGYLSPIATVMDATARRATSGGGQAYLYYFSHPTLLARTTASLPGYSAGHSGELPFLFGATYTDSGYTAEDKNVTDSMISAWTTFAKTGTPSYLLDTGAFAEWPPYTVDDRKYMEIKAPMTSASVKSRLRPQATSFWNVLLPAWKKVTYGGSDGGDGGEACADGGSVSKISRDTAETLLFILVAVVIVLLLTVAILLANYCSMRNAHRKGADLE